MKNNMKMPFSWRIVALVLWIVVLTYFLFFAEAFGRNGEIKSFSYNFVPFKEILRYLTKVHYFGAKIVLINVLGNIACFMPFGFFFASIIKYPDKRAAWHVTFVSAALSGLVEFIQFLSKTGSCDVDDVILNTFGGFLGYAVFAALFLRQVKAADVQKLKQEKIVDMESYRDMTGNAIEN